MNSITDYLRFEHQLILECLSKLTASGRVISREFDIKLGRYICTLTKELSELLAKHHFNEEHVLFPALFANPRLSGGGPRCTLFMNDWIDEYSQAPRIKTDPMDNSPLGIPRAEHEILKTLLSRIESLACSNCETNVRELSELISAYDRKLRRHIEKEDTCLFVLAETILEPKVLFQLYSQLSLGAGTNTGS